MYTSTNLMSIFLTVCVIARIFFDLVSALLFSLLGIGSFCYILMSLHSEGWMMNV